MDTLSAAAFPKLDALEQAARGRGTLSVAVAYPCSPDALDAALTARDRGTIEPVLVGPREKIDACAAKLGRALGDVRVVDTSDDAREASRAAAALAGAGEVEALMKGSQHTDELLGAVFSKDANLRTGRRVSHVFWIDLPAYHKPLMLTDAVVNIAPDLATKTDILKNAIGLAQALGIKTPKVALLSAVETVNPALPSSLDAALLAKMGDRGQLGDAIVDGPLAFDNSVSAAAARTKGIVSPVAGDPDILMAPSLDVGNTLYKSFIYMAGAECAGLVLGAKVPVILTSRADSARARVASCALAQLARG